MGTTAAPVVTGLDVDDRAVDRGAVASSPIGALILGGDLKESSGDIPTAVALCAMAMAVGLVAVAAGRLIHRLNPVSSYPTLGFLPAVGLVYVLL